MAGTIRFVSQIDTLHGSRFDNSQADTGDLTQNVEGIVTHVVSATTGEADYHASGIDNPGYMRVTNIGTSGVITLGPKTPGGVMQPIVELNPDEVAVFRIIPTGVIRYKIDAGTGNLKLTTWEG